MYIIEQIWHTNSLYDERKVNLYLCNNNFCLSKFFGKYKLSISVPVCVLHINSVI